jgi:hypothetical protein
MYKNIFKITIICLMFLPCENRGDDKGMKNADGGVKTVHVLVALCDNIYQGIVPVPAAIGNGQNPNTNLYWGAGFGIRTYFKKSGEWKLLETRKSEGVILERLVFKHATKNYYMVADAYDGRHIEQCTIDFMNGSSGNKKDTLRLGDITLGLAGNASLSAYIGHDGLMNFELSGAYSNADGVRRDVIILACYSKRFFGPYLKTANVNPVLWTSGLMAPEAYTLHDALTGYVNGEDNGAIRERGAAAYAKYQKCGLNAAKRLLITGW